MSGYYNQGPPPPQGGFPPQQGYGYQQPPPPQGYGYQQPPPQQGYGAPPPHPQQGGYYPPPGTPPPGQYGAPPPQQHQQQWGHHPPPQGPPPQQHQLHQQQQQWGPPPPQNQGPPALPSMGYDPNQQIPWNAGPDAQALRKAMKGFGTDEKALISILTRIDPLQATALRNTYNTTHKRNLESDVKSETSGYFEEGLVALLRGPLIQDCHNVHEAIKGLGTKESVLNDVLLGRTNADMRAIKATYHQLFKKTLESDVSGDLSLKTEQLFKMVMSATRAEESAPIYPQSIDTDVSELHRATAGIGTDQITVCSIMTSRSDNQLRAINQAFRQKYKEDLDKKLKSAFAGHMEDALVLILRRATDRAMSDAEGLEDAMAGMGTKDSVLVQRVVRVHWTKWPSGHLDQVKRAYQHRYKKDLISRVKGEVSGDYEKLMVACLQ